MSLLDQLENADHTKTTFTPVPEGEYLAQVTSADMKQETDALNINTEMVIHAGEFTGRKLWYSPQVKSTSKPNYFGMVKGQIYRMAGVETGNGQTLPEILKSSVGNYVKVLVSYSPNPTKPDKPYTNVEVVEVTHPL